MTRTIPDFITIFSSLPAPPDSPNRETYFSTQQLPPHKSHRLGKDFQGNPALLISVRPDVRRARPAPIILENLAVHHDLECKTRDPDGSEATGYFSVVRCMQPDRILHEYFLRSIAPVIMSLPSSPSHTDITSAINLLVELFRSISLPPRKTIQGLWAELFLIVQSSNPLHLVHSWHTNPEDRYDFCSGAQRLEVKSAMTRARSHHFSLEQLKPPANTAVLIASLFVEHSAGGDSVFDIVQELRQRLHQEPLAMARVDVVVASTLGSTWRQAMDIAFDRQLAEDSLSFYEVNAIPSIQGQLPPEISEVRFRADLSRARVANMQLHASREGLFRALIHA